METRVIALPEVLYPRQEVAHGDLLDLRVEGHDVYNITAPIKIGKETCIFGRVEERSREDGSRIFAFQLLTDGSWFPIELKLPFLQDPAVAIIDGEIILSGIHVQWDTDNSDKLVAQVYWTVFYTLNEKLEAKRAFRGPDRMKDIRLVELAEKNVLAFGRPNGRISVSEFDSTDDLNAQSIAEGKILDIPVKDGEWIGANQAKYVDGLVWVLGHVGRWVSENGKKIRRYNAMVFVYDPLTKEYSEMIEIVTADQFSCDQKKNDELCHIIFSGGFEVSPDGLSIIVYVGINDAAAGKIVLPNPFKQLVKEMTNRPSYSKGRARLRRTRQ